MASDLRTFSSNSATAVQEFVIRTYVPEEDVSKTLQAITEVVPLRYGSYANVAFQSSPGIQKFRPVSGSHLGESFRVFDFPVVELVFSIPYDEAILKKVVDRIFEVHIAEEPVIYINESWSTRAKTYSDKSNPNRFWNRSNYDDESKW
jgi:hypothetical protein